MNKSQRSTNASSALFNIDPRRALHCQVRVIDDVTDEDTDDAALICPSVDAGICQTCNLKSAIYKCPKPSCPSPHYCSMKCYKDHSEFCTESFYRRKVEDELNFDRRDKDEIEAVLKREHQQIREQESSNIEFSEADYACLEDLAVRLENGESMGDEIICSLPPKLKKEFELYLAGNAYKIDDIKTWKPWWQSLLTEVTAHGKAQDNNLIGDDCEVSSRKFNLDEELLNMTDFVVFYPALKDRGYPNLQYNMIDILYAMASTLRLFNGDLCSDNDIIIDAAYSIFSLSTVLKHDRRWNGVFPVLDACKNTSLQESTTGETWISFSVLIDDIYLLIKNSRYIFRILLECEAAFESAKKVLKKLKSPTKNKDLIRKYTLAARKVRFYASWCAKVWLSKTPSNNIKSLSRLKREVEQWMDTIGRN